MRVHNTLNTQVSITITYRTITIVPTNPIITTLTPATLTVSVYTLVVGTGLTTPTRAIIYTLDTCIAVAHAAWAIPIGHTPNTLKVFPVYQTFFIGIARVGVAKTQNRIYIRIVRIFLYIV